MLKTESGNETGCDSVQPGIQIIQQWGVRDNHDSVCNKCKQEGKLM